MTIKRMLRVLFSPKSERNEEVSNKIARAANAHTEASNRLAETIRELLAENDRVTGRKSNAH